MSSIRTRTILLTVGVTIVAVVTVATLAAISLVRYGNEFTNRTLVLLCEAGERNLDQYLESAEQSVETVSAYASADLAHTDLDVLLRNRDYRNREDLVRDVEERCAARCASADVAWERVSVSVGVAVCDPANDESVEDVARRADKLMYDAKMAKG